MKNSLTCKHCGSENPFYELICGNCKAYIRERVYNIDLWSVLGMLVENPKEAFTKIIFAEHKNFISFIILLVSGKFLIDSMFLSLITHKDEPLFDNLFSGYLIVLGVLIALIILFSILFKVVNEAFGLRTRFKDVFAILTYSLIPNVFGLIILFTIEVTVFGGNIFSNNPSPFDLKELFAYALLAFEAIILLWSLFLTAAGIFTQTKNIIYSVVMALIFNLSLYYYLYLNSIFLFK
ncbi:MAG: Yip1 family protein [Ignavibacteriaceae bacterium]